MGTPTDQQGWAHDTRGPQIHVTTVLVKLVHIIWDQMLILWQAHVQHIHNDTDLGNHKKAAELQAEIRHLHSLKAKTMAQHRTTYFHEDLDLYFSTSSVAQLQRYIDRYKPVILQSIKRASQHDTQSNRITQFFMRVFPDRERQEHSESTREDRHRKHTKIRHRGNTKITRFFSPLTNPPKPP